MKTGRQLAGQYQGRDECSVEGDSEGQDDSLKVKLQGLPEELLVVLVIRSDSGSGSSGSSSIVGLGS